MKTWDYQAVAEALTLGDAHEKWRDEFDRSGKEFEPGASWICSESKVDAAWREMGFSAETGDAMRSAACEFRRQPALHRLLQHCQWELTEMRRIWPGWKAIPDCEMFYPLVYLSVWPNLRAMHENREIPPEITRATVADLELWMRVHLAKTGRWGLGEFSWFSLHFTGQIYALGRLQFEIRAWRNPFHIYRNDKGDVVALASAKGSFRQDGQFADADGLTDKNAWTADLRNEAGSMCGHPVSQDGAVQRDTITIDHTRWKAALCPEDPILSIHVPANGKLEDKACAQSISRALEFFPRYFPEHRFRAFECISWLMDGQLAKSLDSHSNIVQFQRRFRLLPMPGTSDWQTFERVFGGPVPSIDSAPRDTALRRAVLDHIKSGGKWRIGAGFILNNGR